MGYFFSGMIMSLFLITKILMRNIDKQNKTITQMIDKNIFYGLKPRMRGK